MNPEGLVTHVVDGVLKVWYCNTPPVCWVMGVIDSGLTGSSTVSLRVRPVLGKEGGLFVTRRRLYRRTALRHFTGQGAKSYFGAKARPFLRRTGQHNHAYVVWSVWDALCLLFLLGFLRHMFCMI